MNPKINVSLPGELRYPLEELARQEGCRTGDRPSIPKLMRKIAREGMPSHKQALTMAIAQGMAANEVLADLPPPAFARTLRDRVEAILSGDGLENVYYEDL